MWITHVFFWWLYLMSMSSVCILLFMLFMHLKYLVIPEPIFLFFQLRVPEGGEAELQGVSTLSSVSAGTHTRAHMHVCKCYRWGCLHRWSAEPLCSSFLPHEQRCVPWTGGRKSVGQFLKGPCVCGLTLASHPTGPQKPCRLFVLLFLLLAGGSAGCRGEATTVLSFHLIRSAKAEHSTDFRQGSSPDDSIPTCFWVWTLTHPNWGSSGKLVTWIPQPSFLIHKMQSIIIPTTLITETLNRLT